MWSSSSHSKRSPKQVNKSWEVQETAFAGERCMILVWQSNSRSHMTFQKTVQRSVWLGSPAKKLSPIPEGAIEPVAITHGGACSLSVKFALSWSEMSFLAQAFTNFLDHSSSQKIGKNHSKNALFSLQRTAMPEKSSGLQWETPIISLTKQSLLTSLSHVQKFSVAGVHVVQQF